MRRLTVLSAAVSLLIVSGSVPAWADAQKTTVLITRPVDVSYSQRQSDRWFGALAAALLRFRLSALPQVRVVPHEIMVRHVPNYVDFGREVADRDYASIAARANATHILSQKFELIEGDKRVQYYAEVIAVKGNTIIRTVEESFALGRAGVMLDSCLIRMQEALGVKLSEEMERFFRLPMIGGDVNAMRQLGEAILLDSYSVADRTEEAAREYDKLIERGGRNELAYYLGGRAFERLGRHKKAARLFGSLLDIVPDYGPLYLGLTRNLRLAKDYREALRVAAMGESKYPRWVSLLLEKAKTLDAMGRTKRAMKAYEQILEIEPGNSEALIYSAVAANNAGRPEEALNHVKRVLKTAGGFSGAYFERGRSYQLLEQREKAIEAFSDAARLAPEDPRPRIRLGDLYMEAGEWGKAVLAYESAREQLPNDFEIHRKAARAHTRAGEIEEAARILKMVEPRFSTNTVLQKELGLLEFSLGDTVSARAHLEACYDKERGDARVPLTLGHIYTGAGEYDQAFKMYNTALPIIEDKNACRIGLARLYLLKNAPGQATTYLNEIMSSDPDYPQVNRYFADTRMISNDKEQALRYYRKERELYGDDPYVQEQIAYLFFDKGNWGQAEQEYRRLLKVDPEHAEGHFRLGTVYLRLGDTGRGTRLIAEGYKLGKPDQEMYYQMGLGYALVKMYEEAVAAFTGCVELMPEREEAWVELSAALLNAGKKREAAEANLKLFQLAPDTYQGYLADAGHIYFDLKMKQEAVQTYSLFLKSGYEDDEVRAKLAFLEYGRENFARVVELIRAVGGKWATDRRVLMMRAESYYHLKNYREALSDLAEVLDRAPGNRRAVELTALAWEDSGNLRKASRYYEDYLRFPETDKHRDYAFHAGELYERQKDIGEAKRRYRANIQRYPDDLRSYERLARIHYDAADWPAAEKVLKRAVELSDCPARLYKMLAETSERRAKTGQAIQYYEHYLTMEPRDGPAWHALGSIYFETARFEKAVSPLQMAVKHNADNYDDLVMLGKALFKLGKYAVALEPLRSAHRTRPGNIEVMELLAKCYRNEADTTGLIGILRQWLAADPTAYDVCMEIGDLAFAVGKAEQAVADYRKAAGIHPAKAAPYMRLARVFRTKGEKDNWFKSLTAALERAPRDPGIHFDLARYFLDAGKARKAETHLKETIALSSAHAEARLEYGKMLLEREEYAEAFRLLDEARGLEPENALYLIWSAYAASLNGQTESALRTVEAALQEATLEGEVLYLASLVYSRAGKGASAREVLQQALVTDPDCVKCHTALGKAYMVEAKYKKSVKTLMKAWELGGYDEKVVMLLGRALSNDGKFREAKDFLSLVLQKNPGRHEAVYELVHLHCRRGDVAGAEKILKPYESAQKTGWIHLARGDIHENRGEIDAAWISYNVALRLIPSDPRVFAACGRVNIKRRQYQEAAVNLGRALADDPHNPHVMVELAKAYEAMNDNDAALELCSSVIERFPGHAEAFYVLAGIRSKQNNHRKALEAVRQGLVGSPEDPRLHYAAGHAHAALRQYGAAAEAWEKALRYDTGGRLLEAYRHLGKLYYEKLNDPTKARTNLEEYLEKGGTNPEVKAILGRMQ